MLKTTTAHILEPRIISLAIPLSIEFINQCSHPFDFNVKPI